MARSTRGQSHLPFTEESWVQIPDGIQIIMQGSVVVAHWAHNPEVVGSIPTLASNTMQDGLEVAPARSHKPYHMGSTPIPASN
jgi:hypothetical protein